MTWHRRREQSKMEKDEKVGILGGGRPFRIGRQDASGRARQTWPAEGRQAGPGRVRYTWPGQAGQAR